LLHNPITFVLCLYQPRTGCFFCYFNELIGRDII